MSGDDHYATLGVGRDASGTEIRAAYRRLAMRWHPDRNHGNEHASQEVFKRVQQAYAVLSDDGRKADYDATLRARESASTGRAYEPFFGHRSGHAGRHHDPGPPPVRGDDIETEVTIDLETAAHGGTVKTTVPFHEVCAKCDGEGIQVGWFECTNCGGEGAKYSEATGAYRNCGKCHGAGKVSKIRCPACKGKGGRQVARGVEFKVAPGTLPGQRLRFKGQGGKGEHGGDNGDLLATVKLRKHKVYGEVGGPDLRCKLTVDAVTALIGGFKVLDTLWGQYALKIPPMTNAGARFDIPGYGLPVGLRATERGTLTVVFEIVLPKRKSKLPEDLVKALRPYSDYE